MLDGAFVPERDGAVLPAEAAGEFGAMAVFEQVIEQGPAFRFGHALESNCVSSIAEQHLSSRLRLRAHDRMSADRLAPAIVLTHLRGAIGVAPGNRPGDHAV